MPTKFFSFSHWSKKFPKIVSETCAEWSQNWRHQFTFEHLLFSSRKFKFGKRGSFEINFNDVMTSDDVVQGIKRWGKNVRAPFDHYHTPKQDNT